VLTSIAGAARSGFFQGRRIVGHKDAKIVRVNYTTRLPQPQLFNLCGDCPRLAATVQSEGMSPAKEQLPQAPESAGADNGSRQHFFNAELPAGELDRILQRIEENIDIRAALWGEADSTGVSVERLSQSISASLIDTETLVQRLDANYGTAPLYSISGRGLRSLVKRLLNLPIRVFGRRQRGFNRELITLLTQAPRTQLALRDLAERLRTEVEGKLESTSTLNNRLDGTENWLRSVSDRVVGTENLLRALQLEIRDTAFEAREVKADRSRDQMVPKISSPADFAEKLSAMGDNIKVNIGSAHKLNSEYINVDFRELAGIDVVADVRALPFDNGSLAEISSEHLVEHFRENELRTRVLPYWRSLLKEDGRLRVVCPNWEPILRLFHEGSMSLARMKELTFGTQDYEGNDHLAMYTPVSLSELLAECGFQHVEVVVVDRDNSGCPEMELLARKGTSGETLTLQKRRVEDYEQLKDWYDSYFREHGTWPSSAEYAAEIWRGLDERWPNRSPRESILDVACGGGHFLTSMQSVFNSIHGCDLSDSALREARERLGDAADLRQANAEELPYADGQFDAVTCLGSLEHFLDIERAVREMCRVGKDTALFGILVPVAAEWILNDVQPTEVVMSKGQWSELFARNGLQLIAAQLTDESALRTASPGCAYFVLRKAPRGSSAGE
jgi:SAM-dependent methyltransferase